MLQRENVRVSKDTHPLTPAESLCELQVKQFRKKYGVIENVSDRPYVSNSFHCHVSEDLTPIEKQNLEGRFWNLLNGGKIQYVKYPIDYNTEAIRTLIRRAMKMGFYEGVNLSLAYCEDCGHQELEMDVCPKCGSENLTKIDRMNGYLAYSRVHGDTRLNAGKMAEIEDRKSM
jgi:ribonucleoside-triphosphate reductase